MKKKLLALTFVMTLLLMSCSGSSFTEGSPSEAVDKFFTAMSKQDYELAEEVSDGGEDFPESDEEKNLYVMMLKHLTWDIKNEEIDGNNATVSVEVKNKIIPQAFENALAIALNEKANKGISEEETGKLFIESLPQTIEEADFKTTDLTLSLKNEGDKWIIDRTDEVMMAIFGNDPEGLPMPEDEE
ncbi:MAG: hypothetical protein GX219_03615 [Tissierellia bacterium]|nr:hypothetical protein [Tissierellia bacterium]